MTVIVLKLSLSLLLSPSITAATVAQWRVIRVPVTMTLSPGTPPSNHTESADPVIN